LPCFLKCDSSTLYNIAKHMSTKKFRKNDIVMRQGEESDALYFVYSGQLKVVLKTNIKNDVGQERRRSSRAAEVQDHGKLVPELLELNTIRPQGHVGEIGVLTHAPRSCSVYADSSCTLFVLRGDEFYNPSYVPRFVRQWFVDYSARFYPTHKQIIQGERMDRRWNACKRTTVLKYCPEASYPEDSNYFLGESP
jgi:CRP-like cAMP-binding protein